MEGRETKKYVFILYAYHQGPMSYSLYRVDVSSNSNSNSNSNNKNNNASTAKDLDCSKLEPIYEFSRAEFPDEGMGFFAVGNKFYLFGGRHGNRPRPKPFRSIPWWTFPRDVHVLDINRNRVKMGYPMHGGKYCPLVITVGHRIYVLSHIMIHIISLSGEIEPPEGPAFEAFNTISSTWEACPTPPFIRRRKRYDYGFLTDEDPILSHAVVEDNKILVAFLGGWLGFDNVVIYFYHVSGKFWGRVHVDDKQFLPFPFKGRAHCFRGTNFSLPDAGPHSGARVWTYHFSTRRKRLVDAHPVHKIKLAELPCDWGSMSNDMASKVWLQPEYELLDLGSGCFCLAIFGNEEDAYHEPLVILNTFHVIEDKEGHCQPFHVSLSSFHSKKRKRSSKRSRHTSKTFSCVSQHNLYCGLRTQDFDGYTVSCFSVEPV